MNEKTPFRINYPLNLLAHSRKINLEDKEIRQEFFRKSLFYYKYDNELNPFLEKRYRTFLNLSHEVLNFLEKKYPSLKILSMSVFGSALFSSNPGDFDFLVIVEGNVFLVEEINLTIKENDNETILPVGISIKGINNLSQGILDLEAKIDAEKQMQVIDRTAAGLFKRHLPILGFPFIENSEEFSDNLYAQISDLLSNTYNLYYLKEERPNLSDQHRTRKILSRLYEAATYLEAAEKTAEVSNLRKEIYIALDGGKSFFLESKKIFDKFKVLYLEKSHTLRKEISEKFSFDKDDFHLKEILQKTQSMISAKKIGSFLPVMAKIVDETGKTIAFSKRIKKGIMGNNESGPIHAEINAISDAEAKKKTKWEEYTLYCSLEPCGNCAKKIADLGIKKVIYVLPDPLLFHYGRQREVYDKKGILFYRHSNPLLTAEFQKIYSQLYYKKPSKTKRSEILDVLNDEKLKRNILERLEEYWKCIGLPYKWIFPMLNVLSEYSYHEDLAVKEIRKKFPSLVDKNSRDYSKKLSEWRKVKIKNLAERIEKYVKGGILCDIGGRQEDFIEEIINLKKNIEKAYVTDIESFSKSSRSHKIKLLVQPSTTELPFKEKVDTIILSMVLHHLKDEDQINLVKNAINSLNIGGIIILIEDTYPENGNFAEDRIKEFLEFSPKDKERILAFYDWFGNRIMRNRDNTPLAFNYKTIEGWKKFFEEKGVEQTSSEFIKANFAKPDLFPPKALMIFRKI